MNNPDNQVNPGIDAIRKWRESGGVRTTKTVRRNIVPEHEIRTKSSGLVKIQNYKAMAAIKYHCFECFGWDGDPKKDCTDPHCPLYPFRGRKSV